MLEDNLKPVSLSYAEENVGKPGIKSGTLEVVLVRARKRFAKVIHLSWAGVMCTSALGVRSRQGGTLEIFEDIWCPRNARGTQEGGCRGPTGHGTRVLVVATRFIP